MIAPHRAARAGALLLCLAAAVPAPAGAQDVPPPAAAQRAGDGGAPPAPSEDPPLRGPRGLARWPEAHRRWQGAALAAGLLALAAAAVAAAAVRRARHAPGRAAAPAPPLPPATPEETALAALAALRARVPAAADAVEPFFRELSAVVRRYLEERHGLRAPERTTEEFVREAAESGKIPPAQRERLQAFLGQCDLVKFARHRPAAGDAAAALEAAGRLVRELAPPAPPAGARRQGPRR